ncbi:N-acetylmuramoyl-L-alanine amidase [Desulfurobacterium pacificum]|uniref:N-acetylmuramoyl-L-alanine amidase n=1 Tax=Desulfurobacterium pacificum TaxID=240166 RepID=A0ABY1NE20_9BACT|nr:N-acetylmuramoyl-L-alanine amidase [Desulfurobacterium pacificum]SMP06861.1 N-acetylmuramoyl-L-alanine amidase [Desulfurobacterium pacificum]
MKENKFLSRRNFLKLLTAGSIVGIPLEAEASRYPIIKRIRYSSTIERTRIVFDCSGKVEKNWIKTHLKGNVLWITVKNTRTNYMKRKLRSNLVKEVKVYPINRHLSRIKIVMKEPHKFKIFALKAHCGRPFRLVVDVLPDFLTTSCPIRHYQKRIVVIDPGHGGKDPGAIWPIHSSHPIIKEKNITLAISLRVRRILRQYPNIKVVMTRTRDVYVPLLKRAEIAAKACADAFVSIHADSMPNFPNWSGVTVFKASPKLFAQAKLMAREVAKKVRLCNDVMCWSISPLLLNMSTTVTFVESSRLAEAIVKSLKAHVNDDLINGIKDMQRNIVVLKTPGRPAVLIETGFITNRLDRKRLVQGWYQEEIARGIAKGIVNYFHSMDKVAYESFPEVEYVLEES